MKLNKGKQGISLIVLVITIIVMIIIAATIILTLDGNNIIGRASEARSESDEAALKEAASVFLGEYNLKVFKKKIDPNEVTATEYVREQLKEEGFPNKMVEKIKIDKNGNVVGLTLAEYFIDNNVPIGADVVGYKLAEGKEKYMTSGNALTYVGDQNISEPNPREMTRDDAITWKYFGIDEDNSVLLVGSVTNSSPKMSIGGTGGFLNGAKELNDACEAMYSSSMGKARSIDINDVKRVLEYTGPEGKYRVSGGAMVHTEEAKTIEEIIEDGRRLDYTETPEEGKQIGEYKSDGYEINANYDLKYINQNRIDIIYPGTTTNLTLKNEYWLASSSVYADFHDYYVRFELRSVKAEKVYGYCIFSSKGYSSNHGNAVRPVVVLNSSVQMTYDKSTNTVTLK